MKDWDTAAGFPQEGAVHFALDIIVKVNEPTMALQFIALSAQRALRYKLDGKKRINGVETIGIGFEEPAGPDKKYALGTRRPEIKPERSELQRSPSSGQQPRLRGQQPVRGQAAAEGGQQPARSA